MSELIDRQAAIDAVYETFCYAYCDNCDKEMNEDLCGDCHRKYNNWAASKATIERVINALPSAQPEADEWCHDCKEYDKEHHCCPRWGQVIRTALEEAKPEHKIGKWIMGKCDQCGAHALFWPMASTYYESDYCPNCGADMRGDDHEND